MGLLMINTLHRIKNALVPDRTSYRRIPFGLARGCTLPINFQHHVRVYLGFSEREIRRLVRSCIRPGDRCYDIGASDGYYSLAFARMAAPGWVCCIEADQETARKLEETVSRNRDIGSELLVINSTIGDIVASGSETLDHMVLDAGLQPPDFVKVDIEGAEYAFLKGAEQVISRFFPRMIIEVHSQLLERRCTEFLGERGYRCRIVSQAAWFREERPIPHNEWLFAVKP